MKKYIILFIALLMLVFTVGCSNINKPIADNIDLNDKVTQQEETTTTPTAEPEEIIYEYNETIQQYLTKHNKIYSDSKITPNMVSKDYHHGREHDDQVNISTWSGVTISHTYVNGAENGIQVFIDNPGNRSTNDELKEIFVHYIRVYDGEITQEKIDEYWNQISASEYTNYFDIDDFEFAVSNGISALSYVSIKSEVK